MRRVLWIAYVGALGCGRSRYDVLVDAGGDTRDAAMDAPSRDTQDVSPDAPDAPLSDAPIDAASDAACATGPFTGLVISASDCTQPAVQAAIDAAGDGDTVEIPAGTCAWNTPVHFDATTRSVRLRGMGTATEIAVNVDRALQIGSTLGRAFVVSDIAFVGGADGGDTIITVGGDSRTWRIHDLTFVNSGATFRLMRIYGTSYGVIDHCTVERPDPTRASSFVTVDGDDWQSWRRPMTLGDADAVYVEDNTVGWVIHSEGRPLYEGENGARGVVRFNRATNATIGVQGLATGGYASALRTEVYDNNFIITGVSPTWSSLALIGGGTGVFYNNTWNVDTTVTVANEILLQDVRATGVGGLSWPACDGTFLQVCDNIARDWTSAERPHACTDDSMCPLSTHCSYSICSESHMQLCTANSDCPGTETCLRGLDGPLGYPCFMQPGFTSLMVPAPWYEWNNEVRGTANIIDPNVQYVASGPVLRDRDFFVDRSFEYAPLPHPHPLTCLLR